METSLNNGSQMLFLAWRLSHDGKKAIITVELVDESLEHSNNAIAEELLRWFMEEALTAPWVKEIKKIVLQDA
jgi:hypothetical protein